MTQIISNFTTTCQPLLDFTPALSPGVSFHMQSEVQHWWAPSLGSAKVNSSSHPDVFCSSASCWLFGWLTVWLIPDVVGFSVPCKSEPRGSWRESRLRGRVSCWNVLHSLLGRPLQLRHLCACSGSPLFRLHSCCTMSFKCCTEAWHILLKPLRLSSWPDVKEVWFCCFDIYCSQCTSLSSATLNKETPLIAANILSEPPVVNFNSYGNILISNDPPVESDLCLILPCSLSFSRSLSLTLSQVRDPSSARTAARPSTRRWCCRLTWRGTLARSLTSACSARPPSLSEGTCTPMSRGFILRWERRAAALQRVSLKHSQQRLQTHCCWKCPCVF